MKFQQFYSGSKGNLYCVTANNGKRLLIDPGVTWSKIQSALNYKLEGIEGCFCSHAHKDHSKGLRAVRNAGINIYASKETVGMTGRRINVVEHQTQVKLESFGVLCFDTIHDCEGSLGFVVREKATGEILLFATDTRVIKQRFPFKFSIIAIEVSYNGPYLAKRVEEKTIDESLAKRLLTSHQEESEALRYLTGKNTKGQKICDLSKCRQIHLLHMSTDNINKKRVVAEFEDKLFLDVITV